MTAEELIVEVRKCGAVPLLLDGRLRVAPPGRLPADLKLQLCQRADEIKALLIDQPCGIPSPGSRPRPGPTRNLVPDSRHPLIGDHIRNKIAAIEAEARSKGWPPELLWSCAYWGLPRGLAAVLDEVDEIGEVTPEYIEIWKLRRDRQRFMRRVS